MEASAPKPPAAEIPAAPRPETRPIGTQINEAIARQTEPGKRGGVLMDLSRQIIRTTRDQGRFNEGQRFGALAAKGPDGKSTLDKAQAGDTESYKGSPAEAPQDVRKAQSDILQARIQILEEIAKPAPAEQAAAQDGQAASAETTTPSETATGAEPSKAEGETAAEVPSGQTTATSGEQTATTSAQEDTQAEAAQDAGAQPPETPDRQEGAGEGQGETAAETAPKDEIQEAAEVTLRHLKANVAVEIPGENGADPQVFSLEEWQAKLNAATPEDRAKLEQQGIWRFKAEAPQAEAEATPETPTEPTTKIIERERDAAVQHLKELQETASIADRIAQMADPLKARLPGERGEDARERLEAIKQAQEQLRTLSIAAEANGAYGPLLRQQLLTQMAEAGQITLSEAELQQLGTEAQQLIKAQHYNNGEPVPLVEMLNAQGVSGEVVNLVTDALNPDNETTLMSALQNPKVREAVVPFVFTTSTNADIQKDVQLRIDALMDPNFNNVAFLKKLKDSPGGQALIFILAALGVQAVQLVMSEAGLQ